MIIFVTYRYRESTLLYSYILDICYCDQFVFLNDAVKNIFVFHAMIDLMVWL